MRKLVESVINKEISNLMNDDYTSDNLPYKSDFERFYDDGTPVMVFLDKGFIFVGTLYQETDSIFRLENCYNCRSQSTGKGWGYVAKIGRESCVLDEYLSSPIKFSKNEIKLVTELNNAVWNLMND